MTRLRDMGIEPFLLSSSLVGVLAQRLVRVLNPATREAYTAGEYERRLLNLPEDAPSPTLYRAGARDAAGYKGRTGIYELVLIDEHMRTMIHDGASEQELERYARTRTPGIRDDGRAKVLSGVTTMCPWSAPGISTPCFRTSVDAAPFSSTSPTSNSRPP